MARSLVGALALAALPSAFAFRDTSPFFLYSSADLSVNANEVSIAQADSIVSQVTDTLATCPSQTYLIVRQDGVSSSDYIDRRTTPLQSSQNHVKTSMSVAEAVGDVDTNAITNYLVTQCGASLALVSAEGLVAATQVHSSKPRVLEITFPAPSAKDRAATLNEYDSTLTLAINNLNKDFTVIYTTTPPTEQQIKTIEEQYSYDAETPFTPAQPAVQMELKRDFSSHNVRQASNATQGGLFEKYQYFSPGLFMAFSAMVPLVLILSVGVRALTSLEVSYFAFSKEMGPAAQRKQ